MRITHLGVYKNKLIDTLQPIGMLSLPLRITEWVPRIGETIVFDEAEKRAPILGALNLKGYYDGNLATVMSVDHIIDLSESQEHHVRVVIEMPAEQNATETLKLAQRQDIKKRFAKRGIRWVPDEDTLAVEKKNS